MSNVVAAADRSSRISPGIKFLPPETGAATTRRVLLPTIMAVKELMPPSAVEQADLLDLKLLPAWVKEPAQTRTYPHDRGAEEGHRPGAGQRPQQGRERKARPPRRHRPPQDGFAAADQSHRVRDRSGRPAQDRPKVLQLIAPPVAVRFLPRPVVFENVVAQ